MGMSGLAVPHFGGRALPPPQPMLLFQGDSITECTRTRAGVERTPCDGHRLGTGYPLMVGASLRHHHPGQDVSIFNRGNSGDTLANLDARWIADLQGIQPTHISILIGINDARTPNLAASAPWKVAFENLLTKARAGLPAGGRLIVLEPFIFDEALWVGGHTLFAQFRLAARQAAFAKGATFVPLHDMFQQLLVKQPKAGYWTYDGLHPTIAGHSAIAEQWLRTVNIWPTPLTTADASPCTR